MYDRSKSCIALPYGRTAWQSSRVFEGDLNWGYIDRPIPSITYYLESLPFDASKVPREVHRDETFIRPLPLIGSDHPGIRSSSISRAIGEARALSMKRRERGSEGYLVDKNQGADLGVGYRR